MMKRFFTPPHELTIPDATPLIFLEGPVQGAPDWQSFVAMQLLARRTDVAVASPRRTSEDQKQFNNVEQVSWEQIYIKRARESGAVGIWWAAQDLEDTSYPSRRAYAQTTRVEFGDAVASKRSHPKLPLVVGYDQAYTSSGGGSESYVRLVLQLEKFNPPHNSIETFIEALSEETPRHS